MSVFITGMHRSGISLAAELLHALGYYLGKGEEAPDASPVVSGKAVDTILINNQLLSTVEASWDWPRFIADELWQKGAASYHAAQVQMARQLMGKLDNYSPWAVADPRLCLTVPFWKALVPEGKYVVCLRNPFEVAKSLAHRHGLTENFGIQLWLAYYDSLLQASTPEQRCVLNYQVVLEDGENQVRRLSAWLGITPSEDRWKSALAAIKPAYRHQCIGDMDERLARPRFARLREIYEQLIAEAVVEVSSQETPTLSSGQITIPPVPEASAYTDDTVIVPPVPEAPTEIERKVIVHYHLYKNAGTSVDKILEKNFGTETWIKWEGDGQKATPEALAELIAVNPHVRAVSSHVADIRPPILAGVRLFPIVFLRHPLDRIASVYHFERKQDKDTLGAIQAKKLDLKGYVEWRLAHDRLFKNFQTMRFAAWSMDRSGSELARAITALVELPFFGLVERFDESIGCMEAWLNPDFPEFKSQSVRSNTTRDALVSLEEKLQELREYLGAALYGRVAQENCDDLALYDAAVTAWNTRYTQT